MSTTAKPRARLTDQLLIRVSPDMRARLEAAADRDERTMSDVARRVLRKGLDERPEHPNAPPADQSAQPRRRA